MFFFLFVASLTKQQYEHVKSKINLMVYKENKIFEYIYL